MATEKPIQKTGAPDIYWLVYISSCQNYEKRTSNRIEIIWTSFLQSRLGRACPTMSFRRVW